jgi:hypothetical protein
VIFESDRFAISSPESVQTTRHTVPVAAKQRTENAVPGLRNGSFALKQRQGTHKATVIALLGRDGGASLEEISTCRQDGAHVYSIEK